MKLDKNNVNKEQVGDRKLIAENLCKLLSKYNLNANQLAHILGIPMMTVRRLMSGETGDPRISTLKIIADYFNISIDILIGNNPETTLVHSKKVKAYLIPKLTWEVLSELGDITQMDFSTWKNWQTLSIDENNLLGKKTFAIESRPSMYPRFPTGTIFIIDPSTQPTDGDIVLIKFVKNNEFTLRELIIDPPVWKLYPLVADSDIIILSEDLHEIHGVSLITMLYNPKINP